MIRLGIGTSGSLVLLEEGKLGALLSGQSMYFYRIVDRLLDLSL